MSKKERRKKASSLLVQRSNGIELADPAECGGFVSAKFQSMQ